MSHYDIPQPVREILGVLGDAGHEASIVGGCVRDLLMGRAPKDWDITTSARPEAVQALFPDSFYENAFGTVGVKVSPFLPGGKEGREHDVVEVTTYRTEQGYSDRRRPDTVAFVQTLAEDLARRDFTMNAVAIGIRGEGRKEKGEDPTHKNVEITDPYDGRKDIAAKVIRAVGDADARLAEDALRMMRAVRFASELGFAIDPATTAAIRAHADLLAEIAMERIRDEFSRIVMSDRPREGIEMLHDLGLLAHIIPELETGIGVEQNLHHIYDVWEHNLRALATCPSRKLSVRLGTLLHDVGKPKAKRGRGRDCTFYNHEYVGERMTREILTRLRYPRATVEHAALLVRNHMFYYSVDEVTEAAVRRVVAKVGRENIKDLIDVRIGDRLGSGTPKAKPYKLRHFEYMVDKVSRDAVSVRMLALNGDIMIREMGFRPGPKIGAILDALLAEVIEDASRNDLAYLKDRATELDRTGSRGAARGRQAAYRGPACGRRCRAATAAQRQITTLPWISASPRPTIRPS